MQQTKLVGTTLASKIFPNHFFTIQNNLKLKRTETNRINFEETVDTTLHRALFFGSHFGSRDSIIRWCLQKNKINLHIWFPMSNAQSHLLDFLPHALANTPASVLLTTHRDDHSENDSRQGGEVGRPAEQLTLYRN